MSEKLYKYNQKRDFKKTDEPKGKTEKSFGRKKFVVQHHIASRDHYDFRLEHGGALLSWAVPKGPSYNPVDKRLSVHVEDHPLDYRNFEGTIPKGEYGGGTVMIWDNGYFEPQGDVEKGLKEGSLKFTLSGKRLKGKWTLVRIKSEKDKAEENWLLIKEKDEYSKENAGISQFKTSIVSGRTMEEIESGKKPKPKKESNNIKNPFSKADVQLAKLETSFPKKGDWLFELKYDGYRVLAYLENENVRLVTRNGNDYTKQFQEVADSLLEWANGRAMVLDGEMVITDHSGKTDFQALQNYIKNPDKKNLGYIVFDLLALDGEDLRNVSLTERKEKLKIIMEDAPENLHFSNHSYNNGKEIFQTVCEGGFEGLIGKKADSVYSGTRNGDWIKLKCEVRQEFVIGGYTLSEKKTSGFSSLLLGFYKGEDLVYAGRVGTGFTEQTVKELSEKFKKITRKTSPFKGKTETKGNEQITWLSPEMAAEIKFAEFTKDNLLRHASFKGIRTDKDINEIVKEEVKLVSDNSVNSDGNIIIEGVKLTNPEKLLYTNPKITKAEVAGYYQKIAARMLPFMQKRILSLICCPGGITNDCFFKKHLPSESPGLVFVPVKNSSGNDETYFYIKDISGIISQVQLNTLEFHIWGSEAETIEKPDMMVFDLDPDQGMELAKVRQGVKDLKSVLDGLSLVSYLKTSGGKGYHVVVPFKPSSDWKTFSAFAKSIAEFMEQKWPGRYTSNVRKEKRKGKIFIDWIRNSRSATSIAPYSLRARPGAKVSMPIKWSELNKIAPDGIDMAEAFKRMNNTDPWKDFFKTKESQYLK